MALILKKVRKIFDKLLTSLGPSLITVRSVAVRVLNEKWLHYCSLKKLTITVF